MDALFKSESPSIALGSPWRILDPLTVHHIVQAREPENLKRRQSTRCFDWTSLIWPSRNGLHQLFSAQKEDVPPRFCVDYQEYNVLTVRGAYLIREMDECIESLGDAHFFSTFDVNSACLKTKIRKHQPYKAPCTLRLGLIDLFLSPMI